MIAGLPTRSRSRRSSDWARLRGMSNRICRSPCSPRPGRRSNRIPHAPLDLLGHTRIQSLARLATLALILPACIEIVSRWTDRRGLPSVAPGSSIVQRDEFHVTPRPESRSHLALNQGRRVSGFISGSEATHGPEDDSSVEGQTKIGHSD